MIFSCIETVDEQTIDVKSLWIKTKNFSKYWGNSAEEG